MQSDGPLGGCPAPGVSGFSTSDSANRNWSADLRSPSLLFSWLDVLQAGIADRTADLIEPHSVMSVFARVRLQLGQPGRNTIRPHGLPGDLVVSLTSHPRRFRTLALTLRSLLQQTVQADHIILWLTRADLRLLPKDVLDLRALGLEIHVAEDLKSYTKIISALQPFPNAFICTADDDTYYWPTWLQELVDAYDASDPTVTCHRAHGITVDRHGRPNPYNQWQRHVRPRGKAMHLFPTGCMGVLYPPGTLDHNAEDRAIALEQCPLADDIWLYWIGQRNRAQYKTVGRRRHQITWPGSQQCALWAYNAKGGNDLQIRHLADQYGYPPILKRIAEASHYESAKPILTVAPELSWAMAKL
jgi:hypothetical protein